MVDDELREKWPLDFWQSEEFENVQAKLDFFEDHLILTNPRRDNIFRALTLCSLDACNVVILGQDPYLDPRQATGVAFSSGYGIPASLRTIFREYVRDLHYPYPDTGNIELWCQQGVLLWNVTPTIEVHRNLGSRTGWKGYTHRFWPEWPPLTIEILQRLSAKRGVVFCFLGARAKEYDRFARQGTTTCLYYSHPSPLAQACTKEPFSRFFSTINDKLVSNHKKPIDWRLPSECVLEGVRKVFPAR